MNESLDAARAAVDRAIVRAVLPELYGVLDTLLDSITVTKDNKDAVVTARRLLPEGYKHSFSQPKGTT